MLAAVIGSEKVAVTLAPTAIPLAPAVGTVLETSGGTGSPVDVRAAEAGEAWVAAAVAVAVWVWTPSATPLSGMLQLPPAEAVAVPRLVVPSNRFTVLAASAVPEMLNAPSVSKLL